MKITKEQIEQYKAKHGKVFQIDVDNLTEDGQEVIEGGKPQYSAIFRDIDRITLSLAAKKSAGLTDPIKFNETIVLRTYVDGDTELKSEDAFIAAVAERLQERIKQVEATIKEL